MEITTLPKNAIKLKGKKATIAVNTTDKPTQYNGVLLLTPDEDVASLYENTVMISGAGDYEVSSIKITGIRGGDEVVYSLSMDSVDILVGSTEALEKVQHKVKEHNIVILNVRSLMDPSFATGLATNVIMFSGEKASDVVKQFAKEGVKTESKYQITAEKLPTEMETILLADSK